MKIRHSPPVAAHQSQLLSLGDAGQSIPPLNRVWRTVPGSVTEAGHFIKSFFDPTTEYIEFGEFEDFCATQWSAPLVVDYVTDKGIVL